MSSHIWFRSLCLAGVVGALSVTAAGFKGPQESRPDDKRQSSKNAEAARKAYEKALQALQDQLNEFEKQVNKIEEKDKDQNIAVYEGGAAKAAAARGDLTIATVSSPLKVKGGSVHAVPPSTWDWGKADCGISNANEYCATLHSGETNILSSDDFDSPMSNAPAGQGWTITISTDDGRGGIVKGVLLCNNSACDTTKAPDGQSRIYVKLFDPTASEWMATGPGDLYYHYYRARGDACDTVNPGSPDGPCDIIKTATLSVQGQADQTYTCSNASKCVIGVGKPY